MNEIITFLSLIYSSQYAIIIGKIILATVVGTIIGFERELHGQAAGLRTNALVCLSGCLIMLISLHLPELFNTFGASSILRIDPGRIASYALAGMGFLGAGAIIKGQGSVRGLTTAAGLWLVNALGLAIGAGLYVVALLATGLSLLILYNIHPFRSMLRRDEHTQLTVKCCCEDRPLKSIKDVLERQSNIKISFISYQEDREDLVVTYTFRLLAKENTRWGDIVSDLLKIESIIGISWQEANVP